MRNISIVLLHRFECRIRNEGAADKRELKERLELQRVLNDRRPRRRKLNEAERSRWALVQSRYLTN